MGSFLALLISIAVSLGLSAFGYATARKYVRERLRFVDAVQTIRAPIIAGLIAWAVMMPVSFLPLVGSLIGMGTAIVFGISVGLGVRAGAHDIRSLTGGY